MKPGLFLILALGVGGCATAQPPANQPVLPAAPAAVSASPSPETPAMILPPEGDTTPPPPPGGTATPSAPKISYNSANVTEPVVALTFDDGPHATLTPRLLDLLRARGAKATFYVVGQNAEMYPEIMRRIAAEGHEIGNHSWSHPLFTKLSDGAVRSQIQRTHDVILKTSGQTPRTLRPPYGGINARQRTWIHDEFDYKIAMWSVDPLDWKRPGPAVVARRLTEGSAPGAILLAHDIHEGTVAAMPATLDGLIAKGYRFATVSELVAMDRPLPPKPAPAASPAPTAEAPAAGAQGQGG